MRNIRLIAAGVALAAVATSAQAGVWVFNDPINAGQEVPPSGSPATGTASGTFDDVTNTLNITVNATGFVNPRTAAHIHLAPFGQNGAVNFDLGVGGAGNNYNNVNSVWVMNDSQESAFLAGNMYVNIHTTVDPGGAIRGQLNPVPEPASMIALGLGSLVLLRRRKRG